MRFLSVNQTVPSGRSSPIISFSFIELSFFLLRVLSLFFLVYFAAGISKVLFHFRLVDWWGLIVSRNFCLGWRRLEILQNFLSVCQCVAKIISLLLVQCVFILRIGEQYNCSFASYKLRTKSMSWNNEICVTNSDEKRMIWAVLFKATYCITKYISTFFTSNTGEESYNCEWIFFLKHNHKY